MLIWTTSKNQKKSFIAGGFATGKLADGYIPKKAESLLFGLRRNLNRK
jgi:hypothetical protein